MNRHVFNACVAAGWAMTTAGAALLSLPAGLLTGGVLLLALTLGAAVLTARGSA
jgi:hypothetical protein